MKIYEVEHGQFFRVLPNQTYWQTALGNLQFRAGRLLVNLERAAPSTSVIDLVEAARVGAEWARFTEVEIVTSPIIILPHTIPCRVFCGAETEELIKACLSKE